MNGFNYKEHPHKRFYILTDEWVLVSPHRDRKSAKTFILPWLKKGNNEIIIFDMEGTEAGNVPGYKTAN